MRFFSSYPCILSCFVMVCLAGCTSATPRQSLPMGMPTLAGKTNPTSMASQENPIFAEGAENIQNARSVAGGAQVKIAILVPLSGKSQAMGQALSNAAKMAADEFGGRQVILLQKDSGETEASAAAATETALREGAGLIVGPLFSRQVSAVAARAGDADIPLLALSNDRDVASSRVFAMGFAPEAQIDRIISYAASRNLRRIAALIPSTPYGTMARSAFDEAASSAGLQIVAVETYVPTMKGMTAAAEKIAGLTKTMPIDALFLPEGGERLRTLAVLLTYHKLDTKNVRLLGTGLWDEENIGRGENALWGGWYAAPDSRGRLAFEDRYQTAFGTSPPRLASLAYDAVALAISLNRKGETLTSANLTSRPAYKGLDGLFRLRQDGIVDRQLAIYEIDRGGVKWVDGGAN
jgi:branched-chain amino acid transport system substrate-binding protein